MWKKMCSAFNNSKIRKDDRKIDDVNDETLSLFKLKILKAIDQIKQNKKRPNLNTIYEYLCKTKASNANKQLIETILGNLIETNTIVNRKTRNVLDSFQRLKVIEAPVHAFDTETKQANIGSNIETQTEFPKGDWFSLVTR